MTVIFHGEGDQHTYVDTETGLELVSVSTMVKEVLKPYPENDDPDFWEYLTYLGELGTAVHLAIELDLAGKLDESSLVSPVKERVEAWWRFRDDFSPQAHATEEMVYSKRLGFAGRYDFRGVLNQIGPAIVDWKTSKSKWDHHLDQANLYLIGLYERRWSEAEEHPIHGVSKMLRYASHGFGFPVSLPAEIESRCVVYLGENGKYRTSTVLRGHTGITEAMDIIARWHKLTGGLP